jgi:hypothetical protein
MKQKKVKKETLINLTKKINKNYYKKIKLIKHFKT